VAVNNAIKIGSLVFLLYMFVITENIMKGPVLVQQRTRIKVWLATSVVEDKHWRNFQTRFEVTRAAPGVSERARQ
jgi:hypothetical protein